MTDFIIYTTIFGLGILLLLIPIRKRLQYQKLPTFTEYVTKLPQCFTNDRVSCYKCNGKFTYLQIIHKVGNKLFRVSTCKQCGQILYRVD